MKLEWENNNCPRALIEIIKSNLSLTGDGQVSHTIGLELYFDDLFGKVIHAYKLDHDVLFREFTIAIKETFQKNKLSNQDAILQAFKARCNKILGKKEKYILLTSISLNNTYLPKRRKVNNCTVSFSKKVPVKYRKARKKLLSQHPKLDLSEQEDFLFVSVSVKAPNIETAYISAVGALDIIRAIWQIGFKKNINFLSSSKDHEYPTDSIISLGQVHTLHLGNGKEVTGGLRYEPRYQKRQATKPKKFSVTESNLEGQISKIKNSPFQEHLNTSLTSYINALDHNVQEFRFMKLWSALEKISNTDDSKILIKRVSFFYENREANKAVLESLRKARNINAHSGIKPYNVEMKNFKMCKYLEDLIRFFIDNPFKYKNLAQIIAFISLPTELQTIDEQIANLNTVKKFMGPK